MTAFWWCATGWILGWLLLGIPRRLRVTDGQLPPPSDARDAMPSLSVVIPARDEELSLPNLLADLAAHRPPGTEVVVVDDGSTDATVEIAAAHDFVRVVGIDGPPAGWSGKPWACHVGAEAATGDLLCFVDADVRLSPGALEAVASTLRTEGGLVSVAPWHTTERPWEQASAIFNVVALMGTRAGGPGPALGAFGPLMMIHRSDYEAVGGHAAVADAVVEDVELADVMRRTGRPVTVRVGHPLVRFRMYPGGPRTLLEGWTKNFATGASTTPVLRLLAAAIWLATMGSSVGLVVDAARGDASVVSAAVVYVALVLQVAVMFRVAGDFRTWTPLVYPVWLAVFFAVFFRSLWCTLVRHEVTWRGRTITVGSR